MYMRLTPIRIRKSLFLRVCLALLCVMGSAIFAYFTINGGYHATHATSNVTEIASNGTDPWGMGFDSKGNLWIAQPNCDPTPVCPGAPVGTLTLVNRASFGGVTNYNEPTGYSSPVFVAVDAHNNIWFSEPSTNAIGELSFNGTTPSWSQWTVPTANAGPFDLAFDANGNLWFTEVLANKIGEFNPTTKLFNETPTPSGNSKPYGIVGPDPVSGQMWFTENNTAVDKIGSFVPPASGALATNNIKEYQTNGGSNSTPHLITFDNTGDIWWTEGWDDQIGRLVINQAAAGTKNGVTKFTVPPPAGCNGCTMHVSGIGVDSSGTVWFDDSLTAQVGSFNPGSNSFSSISLAAGVHPHDGLAVDSSNNVFVAEEFANKIAKIATGTPPGQPGSTAVPGAPPSPIAGSSSAPVNKTWYFAEGRVGKSFREYLTIDNPNRTSCAVTIQYNYTPDGGGPQNKVVTTVVNPSSRLTESVNNDLGYSSNGNSAASLATVVSVNSTVTPTCAGVMAERPMYFSNFHGIASGTDVIGATHLSTAYDFADVPTGGQYTSYLTILNPNQSSANVSVTYYAGGKVVGTQNTTVNANARGTIATGAMNLPEHVAAVVNSNQPIMVERPTYFNGVSLDGTGVAGAYDIVGVPTLANDWLFAEGYTSSTTQEYLTIANSDPAKTNANVTIALKSKSGATQKYTFPVASQSQVIWNVNANNTFAGSSPEVSVEVTSSGANIVVQREMYFTYKHTLPTGVMTQADGGTDVIGQVGPAKQNAYSFAEGYSNLGYNEWLTIQNPTNAPEALTLTLVNGLGQVNSQTFTVGANSRYTQDIAAVVQNVFHAGTNSAANSVSMTVTAANGAYFVAERPMYWNTSGGSFVTQGGNDVIGYVGG